MTKLFIIFLFLGVKDPLYSQSNKQQCIKEFIDACFKYYKDDQIEIITPDPSSTWIKHLVYFKDEVVYNTLMLVKTDNTYYIFSIDKDIWKLWKEAESQGQFYNDNIRDHSEYYHKFVKTWCAF